MKQVEEILQILAKQRKIKYRPQQDKMDNENNKVVTQVDGGQIAGPSHHNQEIDIHHPTENAPPSGSTRIPLLSLQDPDLKNRLEKFVGYFVREFETKLDAYYFILEGFTSKAGKFSNTVSEKAGEVFGGALGLLIGYPFGFPVAGAKIGGNFIKEGGRLVGENIGTNHHKKKVIKLSKLIDEYQQNKDEFRFKLANMGCDIFQSFEMQFIRVTTSRGENGALRKLAMDAVNRAINCLEEKGGELTSESIISGESKKEKVNSLKPGFVIKKDELSMQDWNTSKLYSKTGIVILDEHRSYYEKRGESKSDKYGFRRLLNSENWEEIKIKYEHISTESSEFTKYKYVLNVEDLDKISIDILKNLKSKGDLLDESRIKEMIIEVKQDCLLEISKLSKLIEENINVQKQDRDILEEIKQHVMSLNDEKMNEFFLKATEEHQEIINSLDQLNKNVLDIKEATLTESNNQVEKSIWFNVKIPVQAFKGRREELDKLHNMMESSENPIVVTSISGLGGIGKTEFTRKYCGEYRGFYNNNIIWIDAETQQSVNESFIRLCNQEKIVIGEEKKDIKIIVKQVYNFIGTRKCLIILDNAEKHSIINVLLPLKEVHPEYTKPHILITSRNKKWEDEINVISLDVLKLEDALLVVKHGLGIKDESNNNEVTKLVNTLGCFPLAIRQAVSYIKEQQEFDDFGITDYLKVYEKEAGKLLKYEMEKGLSNDYGKTTLTTWKITMEKIGKQENGLLALDILNIIAYLLPDWICRDIFFGLSSNENEIKLAVRLLVKYSMVNSEGKQIILNVHRLVQSVIRFDLQFQNKEENVLERALNLTNTIHQFRFIDWHNYVKRNIKNIWNFACKYKQIVSKFHNSVYQGDNVFYYLVKNSNANTITVFLEHMKEIYTNEKFNEFINSINRYEETPLDRAMYYNKLDVVKCLINYGAKIDAQLLGTACTYGHLEIVKYLFEKVDKMNINFDIYSYLFNACLHCYFDRVKYFMDRGVEFNNVKHLASNIDIIEYIIKKRDENNPNCDNAPFLRMACASRNLEIIKYMIEKGGEINIACNGYTPLHVACSIFDFSNLETLKYLVEKGADINIACNGLTPLYVAWRSAMLWGNFENVIYLLERGAEININSDHDPLFYMAYGNGDLEMLKYLLEKGASNVDKRGYTLLHYACLNGNIALMEYLINVIKIDVNKCSYVENMSPLHFAVFSKDIRAIENLLSKNADINALDNQGASPLYYSALIRDWDSVKHFLEYNAAVALTNNTLIGKNNFTVLHIAAAYNEEEIVRILVYGGVDKDVGKSTGLTPLDIAKLFNSEKVIKYLSEIGASSSTSSEIIVNLQRYIDELKIVLKNEDNLYVSKCIGVIENFLSKNADINALDNQGASPLYYSALIRDWDSVKRFLKYNAAVALTNNTLIGKNNFTVLHIAAAYNEEEIVRILVNGGVDKDVGKSTGLTPLDIAKLFNSEKVIKYLSEIGASSSTSSEIIVNLQRYIDELKIVLRNEDNPYDIMTIVKDNIPLDIAKSFNIEEVIKYLSEIDASSSTSSEIIDNLQRYIDESKIVTKNEDNNRCDIMTIVKGNMYYEIDNFTDLIIFIYRFNHKINNLYLFKYLRFRFGSNCLRLPPHLSHLMLPEKSSREVSKYITKMYKQ